MSKFFVRTTFILVGGYILFWWHESLWSSGGPDINRNPVQYILPYVVASFIIFIGRIPFLMTVKQLIIKKHLILIKTQ
jgi:hypothetical protein